MPAIQNFTYQILTVTLCAGVVDEKGDMVYTC